MAQETKSIDVTQLIGPKQGDALGTEIEVGRIKSLIHTVKRTIAPDSWDCVGGAGSLQSHFVEAGQNGPRWYLIGHQTAANLVEIQKLLDAMKS